ncbi:helix-turn-helix domain-containing protein [Gallionella capsiferriformans]|uniref:Helix-turn-helix domain protein n=1 Tax=Gallionella capsiferriformans (strain ES-2) TaxID=395494 RepID=D9SEM1_GALCS|nr:helix-turn-helix transcriptional regulator [Gallionella capsiferriformans]ADL56916.1 helix-turn-helix domain protein [Gallionella capsiferriformans ES-2]
MTTKQKISARLRFSKNLREARLRREWSQEDLAEESGLHRTYVGSVERGERNISIDNMECLANAVGVELIDLLK